MQGSMEKTDSKKSMATEMVDLAFNTDLVVTVDKCEQKSFEEFCDARESFKALQIISIFFGAWSTYCYVMALLNARSRYFMAAIAFSVYVIRNPLAFMLMWMKNKIRNGTASDRIQDFSDNFPILLNWLTVHSALAPGLFLIARVLNGRCDDLDQLHVWGCNPEHNSHAVPQDTLFVVLIMPIVFSTLFKSIRFNFVILSWAISVVCAAIAIALCDGFQSIALLLFYVPISLLIVYENHRQNIAMFLMAKKQQSLAQNNKELAEAAHNELRFMIANMAHDLKTPLSAFMSGIETLSQQFADLKKFAPGDAGVAGHHKSIADHIKSLFNVNSFMTMTVNRCIDYMKASKGIKLEPKLETINLQDVLSMPLNCMRDLQSRIAIKQTPIPPSVCPHVITDLQWFQENLFCLISNAVKYSSHGHITVSVDRATGSHALIASAKNKRLTPRHSLIKVMSDDTADYVAHEPYNFLNNLNMMRQSFDETAASFDETGSRSDFGGARFLKPESLRGSPKLKRKKNAVYAAPNDEGFYKLADDSLLSGAPQSPKNDDEPYLLVEVEDTGIGISDDVKAALFTPFKQAQRRAGGTGLGLYSLAKRVDALGGFYGVTNRRDGEQGSIFWFAIPYRADMTASLVTFSRAASMRNLTLEGPSDKSNSISTGDSSLRGEKIDPTSSTFAVSNTTLSPMAVNSLPQTPIMSPLPDGDGLRVLLVDDTLTILKMTSNLLKRQGHVVDQEENGADALARLEKSRSEGMPYDVMLMDLNMPVMDGLEAMKRLRSIEKLQSKSSSQLIHQKVFAFSANSDPDTIKEAMDAGADDFICKPFSIQSFNEKVSKVRDESFPRSRAQSCEY